MRWVFRFAVYVVRPVVVVYLIGFFSFQALRAVANAVSSYERAKVKEEIKARERLEEFKLKMQDKNQNARRTK